MANERDSESRYSSRVKFGGLPGKKQNRRGPIKLTLAEQARTMSYYRPIPIRHNIFTANKALFLFGPSNPLRKFAKRIIEWPYPFSLHLLRANGFSVRGIIVQTAIFFQMLITCHHASFLGS